MVMLYIVFCFITQHDVSAVRTLESTSGQNVSFSWTINTMFSNDALIIYNGTSFLLRIWYSKTLHIRNFRPDRALVNVEKFANETLTIDVTLLNITKYDAGTYKVLLQLSSEEVGDSVSLEIIESYDYSITSMGREMDTDGHSHQTTTLLMQKEGTDEVTDGMTNTMSSKMATEEVTDGMTNTMSSKMATEGINHHTTTVLSLNDDKEDSGFPSKRHLLYILLGMGVILAAAFFACILNIIRICLRTDSVSKRNIITDSNIDGGIDNMQEENLPGTYWMIVSNEMGDLSTAIETHLETPGEQLLIGPTLIPTENELGETMKPADVTLNEESDEYLSPVHAVPLELNEYIHPVHSDSVHTTTTSIHFINIL